MPSHRQRLNRECRLGISSVLSKASAMRPRPRQPSRPSRPATSPSSITPLCAPPAVAALAVGDAQELVSATSLVAHTSPIDSASPGTHHPLTAAALEAHDSFDEAASDVPEPPPHPLTTAALEAHNSLLEAVSTVRDFPTPTSRPTNVLESSASQTITSPSLRDRSFMPDPAAVEDPGPTLATSSAQPVPAIEAAESSQAIPDALVLCPMAARGSFHRRRQVNLHVCAASKTTQLR